MDKITRFFVVSVIFATTAVIVLWIVVNLPDYLEERVRYPVKYFKVTGFNQQYQPAFDIILERRTVFVDLCPRIVQVRDVEKSFLLMYQGDEEDKEYILVFSRRDNIKYRIMLQNYPKEVKKFAYPRDPGYNPFEKETI